MYLVFGSTVVADALTFICLHGMLKVNSAVTKVSKYLLNGELINLYNIQNHFSLIKNLYKDFGILLKRWVIETFIFCYYYKHCNVRYRFFIIFNIK